MGAESKSLARKLSLIRALCTLERPAFTDLTDATGLPKSSLQRHLDELRKDYRMTITYRRSKDHPKGYYLIEDWGLFDKQVFYKTHLKEG